MTHNALKAAALKATPGPWHRLHDQPPTVHADQLGKELPNGAFEMLARPSDRTCNCAQVYVEAGPIAYCSCDDVMPAEQRMANALYIALANPQRILAILAELDAEHARAERHARHIASQQEDLKDLRERLERAEKANALLKAVAQHHDGVLGATEGKLNRATVARDGAVVPCDCDAHAAARAGGAM